MHFYLIFTGHFNIIWTDYTDSALLYECYRVEADQRCSLGADHITMLSRTHNMSDHTFDMLMQKAKQLCFTEVMVSERNVHHHDDFGKHLKYCREGVGRQPYVKHSPNI